MRTKSTYEVDISSSSNRWWIEAKKFDDKTSFNKDGIRRKIISNNFFRHNHKKKLLKDQAEIRAITISNFVVALTHKPPQLLISHPFENERNVGKKIIHDNQATHHPMERDFKA